MLPKALTSAAFVNRSELSAPPTVCVWDKTTMQQQVQGHTLCRPHDCSECHRSEGHCSEGHRSEGHCSGGHCSGCHCPEGHRSECHRSEGHRTENQRNYSPLDPIKGPCDSCLSPSLSPDLDSQSSCCCGPLSATDGPSKGPCDFSGTLPSEMSEEIFLQLDARSLCRAGQTCRRWRRIIEDSERLWRGQCLLLRAQCHREVERDRGHGLSWKVTLVRNYARSRLKRDWLRGRFSCIRSANELRDVRMVPFDAEAWGEILEAELDR